MPTFARAALLLAATLACSGKTHRVQGLVVAVDAGQRTITVSHRPVPGLMPAMTMPFRTATVDELRNIKAGAQIQFEFSGNTARKIRVIQPDYGLPLVRTVPKVGELVPDFTLTAHDGRRLRLADLRGNVVAIQFIYTRCPMPEVCPRLAANFAYVQRRISDVVLLSITIDPQYDTPKVLSEYARRWKSGPNWRFLTGTPDEIRHVAESLGLAYWPEDGAITHTSTTCVLDRSGRIAAIVEGSSFRAGQLTDLIARQVEESR